MTPFKEKLPESLSKHKPIYSTIHACKDPSNLPSFWITDEFIYGLVHAEKGFKMLANWGYPPVNLNDSTLSLGSRIKLLRIKNGLKQANLAKSAGIGTSVLARYEQGKILDLSPWTLQKIAQTLKIEPLELLPAPNHPNSREFLDYFCPSDTWGSRLRKLRLSRNIQQKDLAKMVGVTKAAICRYEKDCMKPSNHILIKIQEIINIF